MRETQGRVAGLIAAWIAAVACGGQTRVTGDFTEAPNADAATPLADAGVHHPDVKVSDYISVAAKLFCDNVAPCCDKVDLSFDAESCKAFANYSFSLKYGGHVQVGDPLVPGRCLDDLARATRLCEDAPFCPEFTPRAMAHAALGDDCGGTCSPFAGDIHCTGGPAGLGRLPLPQCFTEDRLYCNVTPPEAQCSAARPLGESCSASEACDGGWCKDAVCVPYLPDGSDCNGLPDACGKDAYCGDGRGLCLDQTFLAGAMCTCRPVRAIGESCGSSLDCLHSICVDGKCEPIAIDPSSLAMICRK